MVIDVCKKYLPTLACGFDDPRVKVFIRDGFEFMKEHQNEYDVIITDSSDPEGPASALFGEEFFKLTKGALREGGYAFFLDHWLSYCLKLNLLLCTLAFCALKLKAFGCICSWLLTWRPLSAEFILV